MTRRAGPREWLGFAVLGLPTLLVSIDVSVMLLALPHISAGLHATSTQTLWIEAFTSGMHLVAAVSAVVLCGVAVFTLCLLGHIRPIGSAQQHAATPSPLDLPVYGEAA
jgi:hypothetical protein